MCQSIYSEYCKRLAYSENLLKAHPLITAHLSFTGQPSVHLPGCTRYSKPGQHMVTQPLNSYFLGDGNFALNPELLLLWSQVIFFFLISHSYAPEGESTGGKWRRKRKETALGCFLLMPGHSSPCSKSPTKTSGYFLIPLEDFQMF